MALETAAHTGNPTSLKAAIDALITAGHTNFIVIRTHEKGKYIIIYTV